MSTLTSNGARVDHALDAGSGVLRLSPTWVPRVYCIPGQRIRLHPDDWYALGAQRGGIDERWLASTTPADNGPETPAGEGLSRVVDEDGAEVTLLDAVAHLGADLIGERLWTGFGAWPMYSKFFDNRTPLPFHIHHRDEHAALTGQRGKPEAYYFPPQMNAHRGAFHYTHFGLAPGTTRDQVRELLANSGRGDNHLVDLSPAFRLTPGTGWDVPPGVLHAPGTLCTYEPQMASDVYCMYQDLVNDWQQLPPELMWKDCPADRVGDLEWLLDLIDWDLNLDPEIHAKRFMPPTAKAAGDGWTERWVCYRSPHFSASELTIAPGASATIAERAAFGCIAVQGHGRLGTHAIEAATLIRYGQPTRDEFFVSEAAAADGLTITNQGADDLVILKHFGPGHPDSEHH